MNAEIKKKKSGKYKDWNTGELIWRKKGTKRTHISHKANIPIGVVTFESY